MITFYLHHRAFSYEYAGHIHNIAQRSSTVIAQVEDNAVYAFALQLGGETWGDLGPGGGAYLSGAGIDVDVLATDIDEREIQKASGLHDPGEIASLLAREKALSISPRMSGRFVLGADQTLALGARLFSKPSDRKL